MQRDEELIRTDIAGYLKKYQGKELLRFVAVGSVDDGKSTLIGRLLHDTHMVYDDQLEAVRRASSLPSGDLDFSLFTDGLVAEREQGITIDVAYRYFATERRKFIIADTPGHVQYTRNMVTGASTANVAIILVDARLGVLQQSRRHATIAALLGIPHLLVAVNKMDLVGYDQGVYDRICEDFLQSSEKLGFKDVTFVPISALKGTNVVGNSELTSWYDGPSVLGYLETVPIANDINLTHFRLPVQTVIRPNLDYRGFAGQVTSGVVKKGDEIIALPSGKRSRVRSIDTYDGPLEEAFAPQSVCIRLEDEIDISRGDVLAHPDTMPRIGRSFEAHLVWMHDRPLDTRKTYVIKHGTSSIRVQVDQVHAKMDMDSLDEVDASSLSLNEIGRVRVTAHRALFYDAYKENRGTGAFVLIDSLNNNTVAAGMITADDTQQGLDDAMRELRAGSGLDFHTQVSPRERFEKLGQKGATLWLSGLPGSGRWALAYALERRLFDLGRAATVIDPTGEDLRSMISAAKACTDAGLLTLCAFPSYQRTDREAIRARIGDARIFEVYVNTDEALCRERRPDADFSGFEVPEKPELTIALDHVNLDEAVDTVLAALESRGQFSLS